VPFCRHRCGYCPFSVARAKAPPVREWLEAIGRDLDSWFDAAGWRGRPWLDSLYVGGGTPSLLGGGGMEGLVRLLEERYRWSSVDLEFTAEANPTSADRETLVRWRDLGVSRVSLGIQALDDGALAWLGREHDAEGARAAVRRCLNAGFRRINLDLIFGLPAEVPRSWRREVEEARDLDIGHLSLYGLTAEKETPLGRRVELGRTRMAGDERYADEYLRAADVLAAAGFEHYEVSNFARPGQESRHNWCYWKGLPYLGVGPSAHSYLPPYRVWNVFRWDAYRDVARNVAATEADPDGIGGGAASLREGWEEIRGDSLHLERLWLGLRTRRGVALGAAAAPSPIEDWVRQGWARPAEARRDRIRLTAAGWLRMDELVVQLAGGRHAR